MKPVHFSSAAAFRAWLQQHHASASELWIGFYRKSAQKKGMTYAEAVDEALCFGWIDGIIKRVDDTRYTHRFTPRKPGSIWSKLNVGHVGRLSTAGKMHPAGLAAFASRQEAKTGIYSFEASQPAKLPPRFARQFRANRQAWEFFNAQPPGYRRLATFKIVMPKKEATRQRWLDRVIAASAAGERIEAM